MIRIRQMRMVSFVAVLLLVVMYLVPAASVANAAKKPAAPLKAIVIFPFQTDANSPLETLGQDLPQSIQAGISASGTYRAFAFSERLPSVQRALMETTLKKDDLQGPFGTEKDQMACAVKICNEVAADYMLIGTIDDVKVDVSKKKAEVALTAILANAQSGETVKTIAVMGETPVSTETTNEKDLAAMAFGNAVTRLVSEIAPGGGVATEPEPVVTRKRSSGSKKLFMTLLVGLAVGLIASSGGDDDDGGGNNGGTDDPPPVPF